MLCRYRVISIHLSLDELPVCVCVNPSSHYLGGMLALGAWHMDELRQPGIGSLKERHMKLGSELTRTCYMLYHRSPTGIAPEIFHFNNPSADFS